MCVCLTTGLVSRASRDSPYDTGAGANHGGFSCSMASRPYPDVKHSDLATPHPGDAAGWKSWLENLVDNVAWRLYIGGVTWLCNGVGTPPKPRYVDGSGLAAAAAMPTSQARAMSAMCAPPQATPEHVDLQRHWRFTRDGFLELSLLSVSSFPWQWWTMPATFAPPFSLQMPPQQFACGIPHVALHWGAASDHHELARRHANVGPHCRLDTLVM